MFNHKIKALYSIMELKQYKTDFCSEFSEFCQSDDLYRFGCDKITETLKGLKIIRIYFKNRIPFCPDCYFKRVVKNGT